MGGPEVDIWSSGVVLYVLICSALPFKGVDPPAIREQIKSGQYSIPDFVSPDARDLLQHMLQVDPKKRFKLEDVKAHRWLASVCAANVPVAPEKPADNEGKKSFIYGGA